MTVSSLGTKDKGWPWRWSSPSAGWETIRRDGTLFIDDHMINLFRFTGVDAAGDKVDIACPYIIKAYPDDDGDGRAEFTSHLGKRGCVEGTGHTAKGAFEPGGVKFRIDTEADGDFITVGFKLVHPEGESAGERRFRFEDRPRT